MFYATFFIEGILQPVHLQQNSSYPAQSDLANAVEVYPESYGLLQQSNFLYSNGVGFLIKIFPIFQKISVITCKQEYGKIQIIITFL